MLIKTLLQLALIAVLPVILSVIIYFIEKTRFAKKIPYALNQIMVGILFGGLAKAGELIRKPTEEAMENNMLHCFKNKVKVLLSSLDEGNVAILGSAALAWNELEKKKA